MNFIRTVQDACNPLIAKDDVGRAKGMIVYLNLNYFELLETYYSLPGSGFAYGKPNIRDSVDVKILTSSWQESVPSKPRVNSNSVNFVSVNRLGSRSGRFSSKAVAAMVSRIKSGGEPVVSSKENAVPEIAKRASGKASVAPENMCEIIGNKFGNSGAMDCQNRYEEYMSDRVENSKLTVKTTKASRGHRHVVPVCSNKEPFKLRKFKNVQSRLNIEKTVANYFTNCVYLYNVFFAILFQWTSKLTLTVIPFVCFLVVPALWWGCLQLDRKRPSLPRKRACLRFYVHTRKVLYV